MFTGSEVPSITSWWGTWRRAGRQGASYILIRSRLWWAKLKRKRPQSPPHRDTLPPTRPHLPLVPFPMSFSGAVTVKLPHQLLSELLEPGCREPAHMNALLHCPLVSCTVIQNWCHPDGLKISAGSFLLHRRKKRIEKERKNDFSLMLARVLFKRLETAEKIIKDW